ncbi:hypothetical protein WMY93_019438 [Mugilogobius chulae]|uniref:Raftlin n=1 Tax=Mugilogobius chulae TaxID=88201 RepID=A0AAW0NPI5_9GOBI
MSKANANSRSTIPLRWERRELRWCRHRLETDVCVGGNQTADPELIQNYVKKIQDVAEQGVVFVGFLQQPGPGLSFTGQWEPEELSSLHSSPRPSTDTASAAGPVLRRDPEEQRTPGKRHREEQRYQEQRRYQEDRTTPGQRHREQLKRVLKIDVPRRSASDTGAENQACPADRRPCDGDCATPHQNHSSHNNNHIRLKTHERDRSSSAPGDNRSQLFALYNHTEDQDSSLRFYSLRVPLRVHREAGLITDVDAHWLDHMTQHFSSGAQLVDGFFHVAEENDSGVASVDSVFIFQSSAESVNASYDAIVVEQWTVVDGVVVKADYIPLLQSLAPFGWRLMCVLPTPIVRTNSDGSLSTKQILFLQRPVLPRRRRDFKMNLKSRNKSKRSSGPFEESCPALLEMDSLRRVPGRPEEAPTQRKEPEHGKNAVFFLSGSRAGLEQETDVDGHLHKSVRWTDVCRKESRGPAEEPVKIQLFSGVC